MAWLPAIGGMARTVPSTQRHQTLTAYFFPRRNASRTQVDKAIAGPAESGPVRPPETAMP